MFYYNSLTNKIYFLNIHNKASIMKMKPFTSSQMEIVQLNVYAIKKSIKSELCDNMTMSVLSIN